MGVDSFGGRYQSDVLTFINSVGDRRLRLLSSGWKNGNVRGITGQSQATSSTNGRTAIGYAPDIPNAAWEAAERQDIPIARIPDDLVAVVKEAG